MLAIRIRYELADLLALRGSAAIDVGKFTIHALENRPKSVSNIERERPLDGPKHCQRSVSTSDESLQHPARQPHNAPQDNLVEADAGFAKFLKEHTSPKHQRVTAGGRVVLVDADKPIPELKPPLKKTREDNFKKSGGENPIVSSISLRNGIGSENIGQSSRTSSNVNAVAGQVYPATTQEKASAGDTGGYPENGQQEAPRGVTYPSLQPWQAPLLASTAHRQQPVPLASSSYPVFQLVQTDQETVAVPINSSLSSSFRPDTASWYPSSAASLMAQGHTSQSLPPQPTLFPTSTFQIAGKQGLLAPTINLSDLQLTPPTPYSVTGLGHLAPYSTVPAMSGPISSPVYIPDTSSQRSLQEVMKEYQNLSCQLASLDRYMAINTFEIDAETKNNLVEQRKGLVKDLDIARRYKEHLESSIKPSLEGIEAMGTLRPPQPTEAAAINSTGLQYNPWLSFVTTPDQSVDYPTLTLPSSQRLLANTLALQLPQLGYLTALPNANTWGEYQSSFQLPQTQQPGSQDHQYLDHADRAAATSHNDSNRKTTHTAQSKSKSPWTSLEIGELHRKIEDAAKRGNPVDELFRKLAKLTEQHAVNRSKQNMAALAEHRSTTAVADSVAGQARAPLPLAKEGKDGSGPGVSNLSLATRSTVKGVTYSRASETNSKSSQAQERLNENLAMQEPDPCRCGELASNKPDPYGPRHSRDGRLKGLSSRTKNKRVLEEIRERPSVFLTSWGTRGDEDLVGSKVCSPVISRVNAHGFLPSFDGPSDYLDVFRERTAVLIDIQDDTSLMWAGAGSTRHWYQRDPRPAPDRTEVGRFFLRVYEEEHQAIQRYRMQHPGENYRR